MGHIYHAYNIFYLWTYYVGFSYHSRHDTLIFDFWVNVLKAKKKQLDPGNPVGSISVKKEVLIDTTKYLVFLLMPTKYFSWFIWFKYYLKKNTT
jgi:hypothetical protein